MLGVVSPWRPAVQQAGDVNWMAWAEVALEGFLDVQVRTAKTNQLMEVCAEATSHNSRGVTILTTAATSLRG